MHYDCTGSAIATAHSIPVGAYVTVTRGGVRQKWNVVVHRHDRNGTYRLRDIDTDTYVTVLPDEIAAKDVGAGEAGS